VKSYVTSLRQYLRSTKPEFLEIIKASKQLTPEAETILKAAISEVKQNYK
jgi:F-type H+-transporting ATPase subunit alpha